MKFLLEISDEELIDQILQDYEGDEDITCKEDITSVEIYEYICGLIGVNHSNYEVDLLNE